jgi:hypothetical protein
MNTTSQETRMRQLRIAPFILAVICFVLPFVEVSCQGQKVSSFTGIELAFGKQVEHQNPFSGQIQTKKLDGNANMLAALICIVAATALALISGALGKILPAIAAAAALIDLIAAKVNIDSQVAKESQGAAVDTWGVGFFAACAFVSVGAIAAFLQLSQRSDTTTEPPPPTPAKLPVESLNVR